MRLVLLAVVLLFCGLITDAQASIVKSKSELNDQERAIVTQALSALETECPALKEFDWNSTRKLFLQTLEYTIEYDTVDTTGWPHLPPIEGWQQGIFLTFDIHGPTIAIEMGWGENSGIAVRTGGGYGGQYFCNLTEQRGEYAYRRVEAFDDFPQ